MGPKKHTSKISNDRENWISSKKVISNENKKKAESESKNQAEQCQVDAAEKTAFWTRILGIFTIILAVIGIGTAFILYFQFNEMQINQRLDQRAGIGQTSIEPFKETKDRIHFEIVYKNTGKTPALEVTSIASVVEDPNDISINNPIENPEKFVIAPGGEGRATTREYGGIAKAVLSGKSKYVIGTIYYRDIFNVWHTTKFCFKINSNATFTPRGPHNSAN